MNEKGSAQESIAVTPKINHITSLLSHRCFLAHGRNSAAFRSDGRTERKIKGGWNGEAALGRPEQSGAARLGRLLYRWALLGAVQHWVGCCHPHHPPSTPP